MLTDIPRIPRTPEAIVAAAEKRLVPLIDRKGRIDHPDVVALFRFYLGLERNARGGSSSVFDAEIDRALKGVA